MKKLGAQLLWKMVPAKKFLYCNILITLTIFLPFNSLTWMLVGAFVLTPLIIILWIVWVIIFYYRLFRRWYKHDTNVPLSEL